MKKLLIMSIALVAIMATVFTVSAFAANTVEITGVTLSKYYDTTVVEGVTTQTLNDAYANATVTFTVTEDGTSGAVDRLTFYLAAQDLSSALEGEEAKVIYIDEQVKPETGSITFVIEKARVKSALSAKEGTEQTYPSIENAVLTFKLGGTNIDAAGNSTVKYVNPTIYGDVDGSGKIQINDANKIVSYLARKHTFVNDEQYYADVDNSSKVQINDANTIVSYLARKTTYAQILAKRAW